LRSAGYVVRSPRIVEPFVRIVSHDPMEIWHHEIRHHRSFRAAHDDVVRLDVSVEETNLLETDLVEEPTPRARARDPTGQETFDFDAA
jgi:hypothetical protein